MFKRYLLTLLTASALACTAQAHEFKLGDIQIGHPYARVTVPQQTTGGAYFSLDNNGKQDDRLIHVSSSIAKSVEIHTMTMTGDVMKMREVDQIDIKAGSKITMKPGGGYHIMLMGLSKQLNAGDKFPMTLEFAKAGKIEVMVYVEAEN